MKTAKALIFVLISSAALSAMAQTQAPANPQLQTTPQAGDLNALLQQIQQATSSASVNIGKLRIEKWKTDSQQRQQMQQVADSLQKNIANAVPGLIGDVQTTRGGVLASFKLYHNVNVLYEFLSSMAEAAGAFGKREEYQPLEGDAAALDTARQNLSTYIEQAAGKMEAANRGSNAAQARQTQATVVPGKKVVIIDDGDVPAPKRAKSTKKKASPPPATAPAQAASSPH
jgi:ubiquinone biosynthesis protein UbiJ